VETQLASNIVLMSFVLGITARSCHTPAHMPDASAARACARCLTHAHARLCVCRTPQLIWTGSYVVRVMNKDMTYVKQLESYEEAVMQKRLEELPAGELDNLMAEIDDEKARKAARKAAGGGPDPML
jgi:hypothetical protein